MKYYANIQLRSNAATLIIPFQKIIEPVVFSLPALNVHPNPTMTSITRFTFLCNSFSSSEPSFKADSVKRIFTCTGYSVRGIKDEIPFRGCCGEEWDLMLGLRKIL